MRIHCFRTSLLADKYFLLDSKIVVFVFKFLIDYNRVNLVSLLCFQYFNNLLLTTTSLINLQVEMSSKG